MTRIETGLATTRNANRQQSRQADPILEEILTRTAGLRFGWRAVLLFLIVFVLGMLLESRIHILYDGCEPDEPAAFPLSASAAYRRGLIRGLSR